MRCRATYRKYCNVYDHLKVFIKQRYNVSDIAFKELTSAFITDFELFLRTDRNLATNTVWLYMIPLRRMITIAKNSGWIVRDPFVDYKSSLKSVDRGHLTKEELKRLMTTELPDKKHKLIRDLFVFCTFTGLSFQDMKNLTPDNLQTSFDGNLWLITKRQKTGTQCNIRLLDIPKKIIEKYNGMGKMGKLLPIYDNSVLNKYIRIIIKLCNIDKYISWHVSRHTFATFICFSNKALCASNLT